MVTMNDVARAAGVSTMTVSNVINGHRYVSDATRDRVLTAVDELGYRVNLAARNLRAGRTGTIGLAVPEIDRPYFGQLAARITAEAERHGYRVAVEQTGASRDEELAALAGSRKRMYDGLILSTVGLGPADADLLRVDYPIVLLGERIFEGPADHVAMPNVAGADAATDHLLAAGCRRIAMLSGAGPHVDTDVAMLREAGHRAALDRGGVRAGPIIGLESLSTPAGVEATRALVDRDPEIDGIFCITDTVAFGALRALHDAGRRAPEDIAVIGFDNLDQSMYSVPSLSTIDPDHDFMATRAVDMLVERISGPIAAPPPREVVSEFSVIERESTRRRAVTT